MALSLCFDESGARPNTRSFSYRKHLGESHLGCAKSKGRQRTKKISLEIVLNPEAYESKNPSMIGRKSLKGWIWHRDDPVESGDSDESVPGNPESNRLGHLINTRPQTRLIMQQALTVSSSRMSGVE